MPEPKLEAINKVNAALGSQNVAQPEVEHMAPDRDMFENFLNMPSTGPATFERVDGGVGNSTSVEGTTGPLFTEEGKAAQGSGSATDQERKKKRTMEIEDIDEVGPAKKKGTVSSSLMEEVRRLDGEVASVSSVSKERLKSQTEGIIAQIEGVRSQLANSTSELRPAYQTVLTNHLNHIDDNIKIALSKAGVEYTPSPVLETGKAQNPIERFLGYLTSAQHQLQHLDNTIYNLGMPGGAELSPGSMLTLQIKMSYVSQQIELFTSLLNKALESTKTIMNVQI